MVSVAKRKALIIGISDYTYLQKLDFCRNDGTEIYEVLSALGYEITDKNKLVGEADRNKVRNAIYDFFDVNANHTSLICTVLHLQTIEGTSG